MRSATCLSLALLVPPFLAPAPAAQEAVPATWEELAELHDQAMLDYVEAVSGPKAGEPGGELSYPTLVMRGDFLELAAAGEPRAALWLFGHWTGDMQPDHAEQLLGFLEVAEGEPRHEPMLQGLAGLPGMAGEATDRYLVGLIAENDAPQVRSAALVARASLGAADGETRELLRAAVLCMRERDLAADEGLSAEQLNALGADLIEAKEKASNQWFREGLKPSPSGVYYSTASTPPNPTHYYEPMIAAVADSGSAEARIWILTNTYPSDDAKIEKLREHFAALAEGEVQGKHARDLRYYLDSLSARLGVDFVEGHTLDIIDKVDDRYRPGLLMGLGIALCENAKSGDGRQARGLEYLGEVVEGWPDSDEARRSAGKLYRFENLSVGQLAPDFEAVDVDGTPFQLSDYKGKVTVIDFWGFW